MNPEQKKEIVKIKQFGFLVSAILLVISTIGTTNEWPYTPIVFLIMMYFLTGSLWGPGLIRVFYNIIGKPFFKNNDQDDKKSSSDHFSKN